MHHHANGHFAWLISGQQSVNPLREAISILSGKYKRFTFVNPVVMYYFSLQSNSSLLKLVFFKHEVVIAISCKTKNKT